MDHLFSSNEVVMTGHTILNDVQMDYDQLEYVQVQISINSIEKSYFNNDTKLIAIAYGFLILNEKSRTNINLVSIRLWEVYYNNTSSRITKDNLKMKIDRADQMYSIVIHFQSSEDFARIEAQVKQICLIRLPEFQDSYKFIKRVGVGSQATIDLFSDNTQDQKQYAVKSYAIGNLSKDEESSILDEILFLQELNFCDSIIHLDKVFKNKNYYHLVMKFAKYGSLTQFIQKQKISEGEIRQIMEQLLLALDLMHQKGIIHRDLKPDNILVLRAKDLKICIADLGLACRLNDAILMAQKCGTPGYIDPEVLNNKQFQKQSDIFSLGSLFYNLITYQNLFKGITKHQVMTQNQYFNPLLIIDQTCQSVSDDCRDLLKSMLNVSQSQRPSAEMCLSHSWFKQNQSSLQKILVMNKQTFAFDNFNMQESKISQNSFIYGPSYFKGLNSSIITPRSSCNQQFQCFISNQSQLRKSTSPQKLCYTSLLKDQGISNNPLIQKNHSLDGGISAQFGDNFDNNIYWQEGERNKQSINIQKCSMKEEKEEIKQVEQQPPSQQKLLDHHNIVAFKLSFNLWDGDSAYIDQEDFEEYNCKQEEIRAKVEERVQIRHHKRSFSIKNQRKNRFLQN